MKVKAVDPLPESRSCPAGECRRWGSGARAPFVDFGMSPLCESFIAPAQFDAMEPYFPILEEMVDAAAIGAWTDANLSLVRWGMTSRRASRTAPLLPA
jgi:hypothetical protein